MVKNLSKPGVSPALRELTRQIEDWRRTRARRAAMPEELWAAASAVARILGISATARAARLDYYKLKARSRQEAPALPASVTFVEARIPTPSLSGGVDCLVELERPDGARMRTRVATLDALAVLSDSFWRCGS